MAEYIIEQMLPMEVSINKKEERDEIDNYYNLIESEYMEDIEVINKYLEQETFFKKKLENKKRQIKIKITEVE